ncbi:hypothetical protein ACVXG9_20840 [Escherichia coli]
MAIGWSQVDGDFFRRIFISAIDNGAAHAIASFFTVVSGKPTIVKPGRPLLICTSTVMGAHLLQGCAGMNN